MVLGVGDEACTLLYAGHMPRATEVRGQRARVRPSYRGRIPGEDLKLVCLTPIPLIPTGRRGPVDRRGDCTKNSGAASRSA